MKKLTLLVLSLFFCAGALGFDLPGGQFGLPLEKGEYDLVWDAPTNELPSALWVYRVLPAQFSPMVISNLMALGSFTLRDRKPPRNPAWNHPNALYFSDASGKKILGIYPHLGFIEYRDARADDLNMTEGVPDEREVVRLGTNYLRQLGIGFAELARQPHSSELRAYVRTPFTLLFKPNNVTITNIHRRSVSFVRRLDGVDFLGRTGVQGGFDIDFGHHAKVHELSLRWRKLEREALYPVARPETVIKWLREGRGVQAFSSVVESSDHVNLASVKKVTITQVTPYYFGQSEDISQRRIYPFAKLETIVDTGRTNVPVVVYCPIIDEGAAPKK
jgi:hypothetical protein